MTSFLSLPFQNVGAALPSCFAHICSLLFTNLLLLWLMHCDLQHTILLKPALPKLALPSLLLTSLDIFSPWPDWHNRNILIPLHFRSLSSHVIYLLSPLRPRLFSILCSLSFLPLPRKCCSLPQKPILHIFIAFKYSLIRINSSTPRTLTPLEKYFQIDIKILFISRLLRFRLWAPALSPINHLSHQGYG